GAGQPAGPAVVVLVVLWLDWSCEERAPRVRVNARTRGGHPDLEEGSWRPAPNDSSRAPGRSGTTSCSRTTCARSCARAGWRSTARTCARAPIAAHTQRSTGPARPEPGPAV